MPLSPSWDYIRGKRDMDFIPTTPALIVTVDTAERKGFFSKSKM